MDFNQLNNFITAVTGLVGVILWPAFWLFLALRFGPSLLAKLETFDIDIPTGRVSVKLRQLEVAAALGAADALKAGSSSNSYTRLERVASTVLQSLEKLKFGPRSRQMVILWVDDNPKNNLYERQAFETLGLRVELAQSTDEALGRMRRENFDMVISDMGRGQDAKAGYSLLARLRESGNKVPFIIYAGSREPEHVTEARRRGAQGSTNSPSELMKMVTTILFKNSST